MKKEYLQKITNDDLNEFIKMLKSINIQFDENKFRSIAINTIKYINGNKDTRNELRHIQELENKWYTSLETNKADYSVYDDVYYLADTWVCWKLYSRQYLKRIIDSRSMAKKTSQGYSDMKSIVQYLGNISKAVDLGCGIGYSTASMKQIFNCNIYGTNLKNTNQYKICEMLSKKADFILTDDITTIGQVDLIFASEYFEHFERPAEHLTEIYEHLRPKYILFANTFNAKSIGHFNIYKHFNQDYTGLQMSRLFTKQLKALNYKKVQTNCWNNRPNFYEYVK